MYSGNMGKTHDIETIVDAARFLKDQTNLKFFLIGDGEKRSKLADMVAEQQLTNVTMLPFQDSQQFRHSIASADIGFVTLSNGFENYSVPSKTYYLMAAGCILFAIGSKGSEMEHLIDRYQCGFRFDPGDAKSVAESILKVYSDATLKDKLRQNARSAAFNFTMENAIIIADATQGA